MKMTLQTKREICGGFLNRHYIPRIVAVFEDAAMLGALRQF